MLKNGDTAPAFMLRDTTGLLRGRIDALEKGPLLVVFYKVNCPTCQLAFPKVQQLHEAYGSAMTVWGISQNDEAATVQFARDYGATFVQLLDEADEDYFVSRRYEITHVPSFYLIGTDGRLLQTMTGWDREGMNTLSAVIAEHTDLAPVVVSTPDDGLPVFKPG